MSEEKVEKQDIKEEQIENQIQNKEQNPDIVIFNLKKLPKKVRKMEKEELVLYMNKKLKLESNFLNKLELRELQYLLYKIRKYGTTWFLWGTAS